MNTSAIRRLLRNQFWRCGTGLSAVCFAALIGCSTSIKERETTPDMSAEPGAAAPAPIASSPKSAAIDKTGGSTAEVATPATPIESNQARIIQDADIVRAYKAVGHPRGSRHGLSEFLVVRRYGALSQADARKLKGFLLSGDSFLPPHVTRSCNVRPEYVIDFETSNRETVTAVLSLGCSSVSFYTNRNYSSNEPIYFIDHSVDVIEKLLRDVTVS